MKYFSIFCKEKFFFNSAYRYGLARVGCAVCPLASKWWDSISWMVFKQDLQKFVNILYENASNKELSEKETEKYIRDRGWEARAGGRDMKNGGNKVMVNDDGSSMTFFIRHPREDWLEWVKTIGHIIKEGHNQGRIENLDYNYPYVITRHEQALEIIVKGTNKADRFLISHLKVVANKTAYCVHCRGCEVECPVGALVINGVVKIDEKKCIHCGRCLSFKEKGCLGGDVGLFRLLTCKKGLYSGIYSRGRSRITENMEVFYTA
ncbi:hypothetical protein [Desulforamulus ferrireducens]|nr:hypothetical protein [Desulforamulus ferrireducens]